MNGYTPIFEQGYASNNFGNIPDYGNSSNYNSNIGNAISANNTGSIAAPSGITTPTFRSDIIGGSNNNSGGSSNIFGKGGGISLAIGAIGTLGNLWNSFQANKLAKKGFRLKEESYRTSLKNNIKVYNTNLAGLARARNITENGDNAESTARTDAYVSKHRLA